MEAKNIFVGWAARNTTPDKPVNLYGQFNKRISQYVKDPVTATALAIGTEDDYAILVSCDICTLTQDMRERCRNKISKKSPGLDTRKVIFNATHTHTAPGDKEGVYPPEPEGVMKPSEYAEFLYCRIAEAVDEAWKNRKEGLVGWAYGHAAVGHNRRTAYFDDLSKRPEYRSSAGRTVDGTSKMYGKINDPGFSHMEGYVDHSIETLFTWDKNGNLTGMIINLACPSQETEGASYISADFWHDIRTEVRRRCGKDLYILAQCSAAGDQSPHRLLYRKAEERMLQLRGTNMRQEIGRRVAGTVEEILPYAKKDMRSSLPFGHTVKDIPLKKQMVTEEELAAINEEKANLDKWQPGDDNEASIKFMSLNRCKRVIERYNSQKNEPFTEAELHIIRLGDIAFATSRFELFLDYGLRIKARSPFVQTFVVQLAAGGPNTGTYLPTEKAIAGKGYSAVIYDNEVGPEGGQQLVEETVKTLEELWNG